MSSLNRINPLLAKILIIALLTLVLLVPLARMESLIAERTALRDSAVARGSATPVGHRLQFVTSAADVSSRMLVGHLGASRSIW
jgi:inner membrane protein involved in colicin E2 resistance